MPNDAGYVAVDSLADLICANDSLAPVHRYILFLKLGLRVI